MAKAKAKAPGKIGPIVVLSVDDLQADPNNARRHPEKRIEQIRASIRRYGFMRPVLLKGDGKTIGAGNGAWEAAKLEGYTEIPTITVAGLSDEEWRAFAIVDNRIPMNAEWNEEALVAQLNSLQGFGFNLGEMGFGDLELGKMGVAGFALDTRIERAEVTPMLPKKAVVKVGELWILGPHRLFIGDATNAEHVARLLQGGVRGKPPVLMATDPPYGVNYDPNWRNEAARTSQGMGNRAIGAGATGKVSNDDRADWTPAWKLFPGNAAYVWHGGLHSGTVEASLKAAGFEPRAQIIWDKGRMIISRGDYHWEHEPCWYVVRKGKPGGYVGDRKQTTMWRISHQKSETGHGTQKPIECMRRPILNNSKEGDGVYDPFSGSGTTLIACQMEKRVCFAMELDPIYAQVIIERWENFAKSTAKREDGMTLEDLKDGRTAKKRLAEMAGGKTKLVRGKKLEKALEGKKK